MSSRRPRWNEHYFPKQSRLPHRCIEGIRTHYKQYYPRYSRVRKVFARISRPWSRHKTSIFTTTRMNREVELVKIRERIKGKAITGRCLSSTWYTIFEESPHNHKSTLLWELISCPCRIEGKCSLTGTGLLL